MSKLDSNGLWDTSRFIMPEFKDAILKQQKEVTRLSRPKIDEQEIELISSAIGQSYSMQVPIYLTLYGPFESREITGVITKIDQQNKRARIAYDDDFEIINLQDILKASID